MGRLRRVIIGSLILILPMLPLSTSVSVRRSAWAMPGDIVLGTDQFGYQMVEVSPLPAFIDISIEGTQVSFSDKGNGLSGPIQIGFSFPYYASYYNSVYLDTNGVVYFSAQNQSNYIVQLLPSPDEPSNLLALLWADLDLVPLDSISYPEGEVFTHFHDEGGTEDDYFVIEYQGVYPWTTNLSLTFEAILYPDGDILYRYQSNPADLDYAAVGIENQTGDDGLLYLAPGAAWGTPGERAVRFERPTPSERVRVLPLVQGGFATDHGATFDFALINNGDSSLPSSSYTIQPLPSSLNWGVVLRDSGGSPLPDAGSDGKYETGPVAEGASFPFKVDLIPPSPLHAGDYLKLDLRAATLDEGKVVTVSLQSAVPLSFTQAYLQPGEGILLEGFFEHGFNKGLVAEIAQGSNDPSVIRTAGGKYAASWAVICTSGGCPGSPQVNLDIQLGFFDGAVPLPLNSLTVSDSGVLAADPTLQSRVFNPIMAGAPNGRIGVVWTHQQISSTITVDVDFNLADQEGALFFTEPLSLTLPVEWTTVLPFLHPRLAATANNKFLAFWLEQYSQGDDFFQKLFYTILDSNGAPTATERVELLDSQDYSSQFTDLSLATANGDEVIVLLSLSSDTGFLQNPLEGGSPSGPDSLFQPKPGVRQTARPDSTDSVAYLVVGDDGGAPVKGYTSLYDSGAKRARAVQNEAGTILVAASNLSEKSMDTLLLNSVYNLILGRQPLHNLDSRTMDYASLATDSDGNFILTAMDAQFQDHLYYAALDSAGNRLTPQAMRFRSAVSSLSFISGGRTGQQVAPYEGGYPLYLPAVRR